VSVGLEYIGCRPRVATLRAPAFISRPLPAADVPAFVGRANELLPASDSTHLQIRALDQLTRR